MSEGVGWPVLAETAGRGAKSKDVLLSEDLLAKMRRGEC